MSTTNITADDELVRHLGIGPPYEDRMIDYPPPPIVSLRQLRSRKSSGGALDRLPLELLHEIFYKLDFKALISLSRANYRIKEVLESFPPWKYIIQHSYKTVRALAETRLITFFDAAMVYKTFRSDRCVCCNKYGSFLFLPTFQRCCFNCHDDVPRLRIITIPDAIRVFGLKKGQTNALPTMLYFPAGFGKPNRRVRRQWLVSFEVAEAMARRLHGSKEKLVAYLRQEAARRLAEHNLSLQQWVDRGRTGPLPYLPPRPYEDSHQYFRFAGTVPFPSIDASGLKVEHGLSCAGCTDKFRQLPISFRSRPENRALRDKTTITYSMQELLAHVKGCPGAKDIWKRLYEKGLVKNRDAL